VVAGRRTVAALKGKRGITKKKYRSSQQDYKQGRDADFVQ